MKPGKGLGEAPLYFRVFVQHAQGSASAFSTSSVRCGCTCLKLIIQEVEVQGQLWLDPPIRDQPGAHETLPG